MFPARFLCLIEFVQRYYSRKPGLGQNDRNGRFFAKSGHFLGTKIKFVWPSLEVVETIPGHTFIKVAPVKWLSKDILMFQAGLSCLAESVQRHYSRNPGLGKNDRKWPIFRQKVVIFGVPKSNSCGYISK